MKRKLSKNTQWLIDHGYTQEQVDEFKARVPAGDPIEVEKIVRLELGEYEYVDLQVLESKLETDYNLRIARCAEHCVGGTFRNGRCAVRWRYKLGPLARGDEFIKNLLKKWHNGISLYEMPWPNYKEIAKDDLKYKLQQCDDAIEAFEKHYSKSEAWYDIQRRKTLQDSRNYILREIYSTRLDQLTPAQVKEALELHEAELTRILSLNHPRSDYEKARFVELVKTLEETIAKIRKKHEHPQGS